MGCDDSQPCSAEQDAGQRVPVTELLGTVAKRVSLRGHLETVILLSSHTVEQFCIYLVSRKAEQL
jgi:hypothetical protein